MKVLMDECLPHDLRHLFPQHEFHSTEWAGLKGLANGQLLAAAEANGYGVFLTVDNGLSHQQNLNHRRISLIVVRVRTNKLEDLAPLAAQIGSAIEAIGPGEVVTVPTTVA